MVITRKRHLSSWDNCGFFNVCNSTLFFSDWNVACSKQFGKKYSITNSGNNFYWRNLASLIFRVFSSKVISLKVISSKDISTKDISTKEISMKTFLMKEISSKEISSKEIIVESNFVEFFFVESYFIDRHFIDRHFSASFYHCRVGEMVVVEH